jgi:hypothetical protein
MAFSRRFWGKPPIPSVRTAGLWVLCWIRTVWNMKREWHLFVRLVRNYSSSGVYMKQTEGHNFCVDFTNVVQTRLTFDPQQTAWPYILQDDGLKWPPHNMTRPWTFIGRNNENSLLGRELFRRPSFCTLALKMWVALRSVRKNRLCCHIPRSIKQVDRFRWYWRSKMPYRCLIAGECIKCTLISSTHGDFWIENVDRILISVTVEWWL